MINNASNNEKKERSEFVQLFKDCPIPEDQILNNIGLFTRRQVLSRILMLNDIYKKILNIQGIICEFGVHWGQSLALFESLRGMYEPYNYSRKIVGFDTFEGFPEIHEKDGSSKVAIKGEYSTTKDYELYLEDVLRFHESESPVSHIKKFELVKGDACLTVPEYLKRNPETIIAFAYFDFDIYKPTKICLESILPHLTKGAVIGFDELNCHDFPGETAAFREVFGNRFKIHRDINNPIPSYIIWE